MEKETQEPDRIVLVTEYQRRQFRENAGTGSQPSERNLQADKPHLPPILDRDAETPAKRQPEDGGGGREAPGTCDHGRNGLPCRRAAAERTSNWLREGEEGSLVDELEPCRRRWKGREGGRRGVCDL
jgi:hypothetical protein